MTTAHRVTRTMLEILTGHDGGPSEGPPNLPGGASGSGLRQARVTGGPASTSPQPIRLRSISLQLGAEIATLKGDRGGALDTITRAAEEGLFDLAWMDRCPLLAELRQDPALAAARAMVAVRAIAAEEAYRAPEP